jgi:hypothetical protein
LEGLWWAARIGDGEGARESGGAGLRGEGRTPWNRRRDDQTRRENEEEGAIEDTPACAAGELRWPAPFSSRPAAAAPTQHRKERRCEREATFEAPEQEAAACGCRCRAGLRRPWCCAVLVLVGPG